VVVVGLVSVVVVSFGFVVVGFGFVVVVVGFVVVGFGFVVVGFGFVVVVVGFGFVGRRPTRLRKVVGGFRRVGPLSKRGTLTPTPASAPAPTPPVGGGVVGVVDAVALVVDGAVVTGVTDRDALDGNDDAAAGASPAPPTPSTTPKTRTTATAPPNTFRRAERARRESSKATATHFQMGSGKRGDAQTTIAPPMPRSFAVGRSFRAFANPPRAVGPPRHDDPVTDERPEIPTVFDRLSAAGLSQERIEQHLMAGRVRVDGELVTDLDRPAPPPARVVLWTE
jgi:hypothetical protein